MQKLLVYSPETGLLKSPSVKEISSYLKENNLVWLDIKDPQEADYKLITELFTVHALAIEDMKTGYSLPKIVSFPDSSFIIWQALGKEQADEFETPRLYFLISSNYLLTLHEGEMPVLNEVIATCERDEALFRLGTGMILYTILDDLVDQYFLILDKLSDQVDLLEDKMFGEPTSRQVREIFDLKRKMLVIRRMAAPEREIINAILRRELPYIGREMEAYYEDIYDHLVRIIDLIDTLRDLISGAMEIYLSNISNKLNVIMKTLTIVATIMMPATLIASIFGMNFKFMPWLSSPYAFTGTIVVMILIALVMLLWAWRRKWL